MNRNRPTEWVGTESSFENSFAKAEALMQRGIWKQEKVILQVSRWAMSLKRALLVTYGRTAY